MQIQSLNTVSLSMRKIYLLLILCMLYITFKLTCNPLFFRQVQFTLPIAKHLFKLNSSAFMYPGIYVIADAIVYIAGRKLTTWVIVIAAMCDGIFSYTVSYFTSLPIPGMMSQHELLNTLAINTVGDELWQLFYHGLFAALIAAVAEILIFSLLFKKLKSFFFSTIISVIVTLICHNLINDYQMLKHEPDVWSLIINNWLMNIAIMIAYAALISFILKLNSYLANSKNIAKN